MDVVTGSCARPVFPASRSSFDFSPCGSKSPISFLSVRCHHEEEGEDPRSNRQRPSYVVRSYSLRGRIAERRKRDGDGCLIKSGYKNLIFGNRRGGYLISYLVGRPSWEILSCGIGIKWGIISALNGWSVVRHWFWMREQKAIKTSCGGRMLLWTLDIYFGGRLDSTQYRPSVVGVQN